MHFLSQEYLVFLWFSFPIFLFYSESDFICSSCEITPILGHFLLLALQDSHCRAINYLNVSPPWGSHWVIVTSPSVPESSFPLDHNQTFLLFQWVPSSDNCVHIPPITLSSWRHLHLFPYPSSHIQSVSPCPQSVGCNEGFLGRKTAVYKESQKG